MSKALVSILTPCYNTGHCIHRLLDSILVQDYPNVEMYVIDDGSTDNSKNVIESYITRFNDKGYSLNYVYQENGGQSSAINSGLKLINGEYLLWPDSDDYYSNPSAITKMQTALEEQSEEYSCCRCMSTYIEEISSAQKRRTKLDGMYQQEDLFDDCMLDRRGFMWGAGNYMARVSVLRKNIPNLEIYTEKRAGQNWQMLLPLFYKHKCISIPEYLFNIVERSDSHSRGTFSGYEQVKEKFLVYERTLKETLRRLDAIDSVMMGKYFRDIEKKYSFIHLRVALEHSKTDEARKEFRRYRTLHQDVSPLVILYYRVASYMPILYRGCMFLKRQLHIGA